MDEHDYYRRPSALSDPAPIPQFVRRARPLTDPMDRQVGGNHYKDMPIQPAEYNRANDEYLGWFEQNIIKYVSRHKFKNGIEDILKAQHYIDMILKEYEEEL